VPRVVEDIQSKLEFQDKNVFSKSFVRNNLAYVVSREDDKIKKLLRVCNGVKGSGIIYVRNRRLTREIAELLSHHGISAGYYHAGLEPGIRLSRQHDWMNGITRIIVATNAFGMGIDKPDVRLVVHLDLPDTLEAYYQEAGRVGRDGKKSYAVLLFNEHDIVNSRHHLELAWPDPDTVRQVYQALGNYLQLPIGAGKDVSFDFEVEKFSSNYKMKPVTVFNALKILERDGYITLNDAWDDPSRIFIVCSKDEMYRYQVENSEADKILRIILRSYSGVFTDFTRINENEIARRSGIDSPKVNELLTRMQKHEILEYLPRKNSPQLIFNTERLDAGDIALSKTFYAQRKKEAFSKLESTIRYATSELECRSSLLVSYFGEKKVENCGVCDVCLRKKRKDLDEKKSSEIEQLIVKILEYKPVSVSEIVQQMNQFREKDVLVILRWMVEEGRIQEEGEIIKSG